MCLREKKKARGLSAHGEKVTMRFLKTIFRVEKPCSSTPSTELTILVS